MKACRHPIEYRLDRAIFRIGHDVVTTMRTWWADGDRIAECAANRCSRCGVWLPLETERCPRYIGEHRFPDQRCTLDAGHDREHAFGHPHDPERPGIRPPCQPAAKRPIRTGPPGI